MERQTFSEQPEATHVGWLRELPRGRWRQVCSGASESKCWDALLPLGRWMQGCEKIVLPANRKP